MKSARLGRNEQATSDAALAAFSLAHGDQTPLRVQLANELKRLILQRILQPGSKLPASRSLAEELGVSRVTVVSAIEELVAEGYAEGYRGSGVYVSGDLPEQTLEMPVKDTSATLESSQLAPLSPLRPAAPEVRLFPHETWARLMLKTWRAPDEALLGLTDPMGWPPLRQAIAEHLAAFRGMLVSPHQVIITSGANEALEAIARTLLEPGDRVFVEEPGYPTIWRTLADTGLVTRHVPVDRDGFDIANAEGEAAAALVTPSRHYPTGVTMPLARRLGLIEWALKRESFIIEDDYDSEYRYRGRPLPALASLDEGGRVLYVGSFSKTMLPGLRLGFLVVPPALADRFVRTVAERGPRASLMMQPVLARFIAEGHLGAHIRRMRRLYARRQATLIAAIARDAEGILSAQAEPAGMHLVCRLTNMDDRQAETLASEAGIAASALSRYFAGAPSRQGLLLGYAGYDEQTIDDAVKRLGDALRATKAATSASA
jgi:GntR family transcriptional regulator/MocR family aminotransferase